MSYPNLQTVKNAFAPASLASEIPNVAQVGQEFGLSNAGSWSEVDENGNANGVPLGQSGPFVIKVNSEQILCASFKAGIVVVFDDDGTDGRAYDETTIAVHAPGAAVTLLSTSVQSQIAPTFPTFTGSGSPEGSQTATAKNQSYVDSDTGNLWLYNGTPPSDTGWVNQAGGAWGQASTAKFSGTGSPVGVVTPTGSGDLYVDETLEAPALWQATGTEDSDWEPVVAPPVPVTTYAGMNVDGSVGTSPILLDVQASIPGSNKFCAVATSTPTVVAPLGNVLDSPVGSVTGVDTTTGPFIVDVTITVSNLAATEVLQINASAVANAGIPGDSAAIDWTTADTTPIAGTDLTWDGTSLVTSTAGGVFVVSLAFEAGYE